MSSIDVNRKTTFGLLPENEGRSSAFTASIAINITIAALLLFVSIAKVHHDMVVREKTMVFLPTKQEPPKPKPEMPKPPKIEPPKVEPPKIEQPPKIEPPPPVKQPPPTPIKQPPPPVERKPLPIQTLDNKTVTLDKNHVNVMQNQQIAVVNPNHVLKVVPNAASDSRTRGNKPEKADIHMGDAFGVKPNPNAHGPATITSVGTPGGSLTGAVRAPQGIAGSMGSGNGTRYGQSAGVPGKVAVVGAPKGPTNSNNRVSVATVQANTGPVAPVSSAVRPSSAPTTPPDVTYKPKPEYTAEGRNLKVEGNVVLQVRFRSSGQIEILNVLHSLGHGLDEQAKKAAQNIRFKPAMQGGHPVDFVGSVTITFQLA
jgi:TonB family protein